MPQQYMEFEESGHPSREYAGNTFEHNQINGVAGEKVNNQTFHPGFSIHFNISYRQLRTVLSILSILIEIIALIVMYMGVSIMYYLYDFGSAGAIFRTLLIVLFLLVTGFLIFVNVLFARKR
jgi:hypothetical protein